MKLSSFNHIALLFIFLSSVSFYGQTIKWIGKNGANPIQSKNWIIEGSKKHPKNSTILSNGSINYSLLVENDTIDLSKLNQLNFKDDTMSISLNGAYLKGIKLTKGQINLSNASTLELSDTHPFGTKSIVAIKDNSSWIKLTNVNPLEFKEFFINVKLSHHEKANSENLRVNQYYYLGSLVRPLHDAYKPCKLFKNQSRSDDSLEISEFKIYRAKDLKEFNNSVSSLFLDRGYMITLAENEDGTGKSKVYIADESPLFIDLKKNLNNAVSFIRVMPWNWVTKKGVAGFKKGIGASWTYNWGNKKESLPNMEYAPMAWSGRSATKADVAKHITKKNVTHFMGFNECDNCHDQSGQYDNLCNVDVAIPLYENLMGTGLRLVSPSLREEGPFGWLEEFVEKAEAQNIRIDVIGVHWYDWGSKPKNSPYEDAKEVFERFKTYLQRVYDKYQRPIWITEFNANPNRDVSVHIDFVKLVLPYLEQLDYVERYCYFEPFKHRSLENGVNPTYYREKNGLLTAFGKVYVELGVSEYSKSTHIQK
ncbi:glycosyl hydrolase [Polaribacter sp. M15]